MNCHQRCGTDTFPHVSLRYYSHQNTAGFAPSEFGAADETTAIAVARELPLDSDLLLAMAGKVSSELQTIIRKRPKLFADLIRALKDQPDHAVLRIVREVRDGNW